MDTDAEKQTSGTPRAPQDDGDDVRIMVDGQQVIITKRNELIINDECKRIMQNLCTVQVDKDKKSTKLIQPTFLSAEDRLLFFKTKMFYLLQERHSFYSKIKANLGNEVSKSEISATVGSVRNSIKAEFIRPDDSMITAAAAAYPEFLSPFCGALFDIDSEGTAAEAKKRRRRSQKLRPQEEDSGSTSSGSSPFDSRRKPVEEKRMGMVKFLDNVRKADPAVLRMLQEKTLKTLEGGGYAALFNIGVRKADVIFSMFPDYNYVAIDGKDEESKLNNLGNHVRARVKMFDKLQLFYDHSTHDDTMDHTAHVFAMPSQETGAVREELFALIPKKLHRPTEKMMLRLYAAFKDDYSSAKTTLIADGTQPVVLSRKKMDKVKKYVDECAETKVNMLVPYVPEMNFFFLTIPWIKSIDSPSQKDQNYLPSVERPEGSLVSAPGLFPN